MPYSSRPLAPWSVYRFNFTMIMSLLHRLTGVALTLTLWWGVLVWSGLLPNPLNAWMDFWPMRLIITGVIWMLSYHAVNGLRHLIWDQGRLMEPHTLFMSGSVVCVASLILTWCILHYGVGL